MHQIELFDDNVAILPLETTGVSAGGILIPETARKKSQRGRVLFVGPGRLKSDGESRWPMPVQKGDIALYMQYAGHEIDAGEHTITIMKASDLLGCLKEVPEAIEKAKESGPLAGSGRLMGMDRPPCPICGVEVINGPSEHQFWTENCTAYLCEVCGTVTVGDDGIPCRRMAQCRNCGRVDFLNVHSGGRVVRVAGCRCNSCVFDVLSLQDAAAYHRGREVVAS